VARERNLAEEAWPGEIIGAPMHGSLRIGDTLPRVSRIAAWHLARIPTSEIFSVPDSKCDLAHTVYRIIQ
jgi:peptide subunit release factor RF-3